MDDALVPESDNEAGEKIENVLILVVMDDALVLICNIDDKHRSKVLILVVMDDALVRNYINIH